MDMKLRFLGAARNVTGSKYLLEANGARILIDYGMYQERDLKERNWRQLPVPPESIDAVLLTHAHLDHCGLVPKLVGDGFKGKVICTNATAGLARIVMLDSAHIQEEDAKYKQKRHKREGRSGPHPVVPLYTKQEAEEAIELMAPVRYGTKVKVADGIEASFHEAGHILGAGNIRMRVKQGDETRTLLFSGDVGRANKPILRDPEPLEAADYVVVESTYGDRVHTDPGDQNAMLAEIVNSTVERGGNLVIPAFAIGRSQELLYRLNELLRDKEIPPLAVFVDSPMAIRVTDVFRRYPHLFDEEMKTYLREGESPFEFPMLTMSRTTKQSKAINSIRGSVIIMAGSGMCTGGRIKHHLVHNISRPEATLLFVGYQAKDTLGGLISRGAKEARIHGQEYRIRARVEQIHGFSAHADRDELLSWLSTLPAPPRKVFVTHGDEKPALSFVELLKSERGWDAIAPEFEDSVDLD